MERLIFETEDFPQIVAEKIKGSLKIKGWNKNSFRVDTESKESTKIEKNGNSFNVNSSVDCIFRVPFDSDLVIENVLSDLIVKEIENKITIENVKGQIILKNVGPTIIENVAGNISAKQIEGDLVVEVAKGNVMIRDMDGSVSLENGLGNFNYSGISQKLDITTKGNATISLIPEFDGDYSVISKGNITCQVGSTLNANAKLISKANVIRIITAEKNETINEEEYELNIEDNDFKIDLEAGGSIDFVEISNIKSNERTSNFDQLFEMKFNEDNLNSLADDITQQVTESIGVSIGSITEQINVITANLSKNKLTAEKARQELKNKKHELKHLARSQRNVAHKARQSAQKARRSAHQVRVIKHHSLRKEKPVDPVSDEEREIILQMLQDKKIDIEQAEILLAAIEGKEFRNSGDDVVSHPETVEVEVSNLEDLADLADLADIAKVADNVEELDLEETDTEIDDID